MATATQKLAADARKKAETSAPTKDVAKIKKTVDTTTDPMEYLRYMMQVGDLGPKPSSAISFMSDRDQDAAQKSREYYRALENINRAYGIDTPLGSRPQVVGESAFSTTTKQFKVGGKTYNTREEAQKAAKEINEKRGYVQNEKGKWVPASGSGGGGGNGGRVSASRREVQAPVDIDTSTATGDGQVGSDKSNNIVPGTDDAEVVQTGNLKAKETLNPNNTRKALRNFNSQRDVDWTRFMSGLDEDIARALTANTDAAKRTADQINVSKYTQPYFADLKNDFDVNDDPRMVYSFGDTLNDDTAQAILDAYQTDFISKAKNRLDNKGLGYDENSGRSDFAQQLFGKDLYRGQMRSTLNEQQGLATNALDRALSYGQIGQEGYDYAIGQLGDMRAAGRADMNTIGQGLLDTAISDTDKRIADAYGNIDALGFGSKYNARSAYKDINRQARQDARGIGDTFVSTVGDSEYFDIGNLLSKASRGSGLFDPIKEGTASALFSTMADRERKQQEQRGLGSQGSF